MVTFSPLSPLIQCRITQLWHQIKCKTTLTLLPFLGDIRVVPGTKYRNLMARMSNAGGGGVVGRHQAGFQTPEPASSGSSVPSPLALPVGDRRDVFEPLGAQRVLGHALGWLCPARFLTASRFYIAFPFVPRQPGGSFSTFPRREADWGRGRLD